MLMKLELAAIAGLDEGRIGMAFADALRRCEEHCRDLPALEKPRKVLLEVSMVPEYDATSQSCVAVAVSFKVADTVPKRESTTYVMKALHGGGLVYNDMSPDDIRQMTLDQANQQQEARRIADAR